MGRGLELCERLVEEQQVLDLLRLLNEADRQAVLCLLASLAEGAQAVGLLH